MAFKSGYSLYFLLMLQFLRPIVGDLEQVDEHCGTWMVSQGFGLPSYIERKALNDMTFYSYRSELKSEVPRPEWVHTTEAQNHWNDIQGWSSHNRYVFNLAFEQAVLQFNKTGSLSGANLYQSSGCCRLYPNGTYKAWLSGAFNGMDFVYFDIDSRTYIPLVPQATIYKILREKDHTLDIIATYYREKCLKRLNAFKEAAGDRFRMVPKVKLFENQNHGKHLLTCHVTGFYPREIQVELKHPMTPGYITDDVSQRICKMYLAPFNLALPVTPRNRLGGKQG